MFADFHGVNTPTMVISSYQSGITELEVGKRCEQSAHEIRLQHSTGSLSLLNQDYEFLLK